MNTYIITQRVPMPSRKRTIMAPGIAQPPPGSAPTLTMAAFAPSANVEYVWGLEFAGGNGHVSMNHYNGSTWAQTIETASEMFGGSIFSYAWVDRTDTFGSGVDGGFFYAGNTGDVHFWTLAALSDSTLPTSEDISLNSSETVTGFWDGADLHAFYVGAHGYIYEAYIAGSSLTTSNKTGSGSWEV